MKHRWSPCTFLLLLLQPHTILSHDFHGSLLGAHVHVATDFSSARVTVTCLGTVQVHGTAWMRQSSKLHMDEALTTSLARRGVRLQGLDVTQDWIDVVARLPLLGVRRVRLSRASSHSSNNPISRATARGDSS